MRPALSLGSLTTGAMLFLAACGTPQERCISRETKDLRVMNRLIAESEGNLKRGYALEEVTVYTDRWDFCHMPPPPPVMGADGKLIQPPPPPPRMCLRQVAETETRPKSIDLKAEAAKLAEMKKKKIDLNRSAIGAVEMCKIQHPENKKS